MKRLWIVVSIAIIMLATIFAVIYIFSSNEASITPENNLEISLGGQQDTSQQDIADGLNNQLPSPNTTIPIVILSISVLFLTFLSLTQYMWRRTFLSNPHILFPEEQAKYFTILDKNFKLLIDATNNNFKNIDLTISQNSDGLKNLQESSMILQNGIDTRDKEIARLKKGYDQYLLKKYLQRFVKLHQYLAGLEINESEKDLNNTRLLLEDALEECGIELYQPEIGTDYKSATGVSDSPDVVHTNDPSNNFKIKDITKPGYILRYEESFEVIIPADVTVWLYQGEKE